MEPSAPFPSREQLALALAVVKSKPVGLDIKEYILQIRQTIKAKQDAEIFRSPKKFFDSVAFWKSAYEKSESEQSKLQDRIYELEQRNDTLLTKIRAQDGTAEGGMVQEKAKRKLTRIQPARKRTKTQPVPTVGLTSADAQALLQDDAADDLDSLSFATSTFMRQLYVLQKVLQKRPSNIHIAQAAIALCKTTATGVVAGGFAQESPNAVQARSGKEALTRSQSSHMASVLRVVDAATSLLYQAQKKLFAGGKPGNEAGLLTYHIVCLYEAIMDALEEHCETQASQTAEAKKLPPQKRANRSKKSKTSVEAEPESKTDSEGATQLALLLNRMITLLDLAHPGHQNLLEGFLFILLSRVGKFLCLFVFQDLQLRPDLRVDPHRLLPAGLADTELNDKSLDAARLEAKPLIWLLERALSVLDACTSVPTPGGCGNQPEKAQFISKIKERLQSTLVQAVFGSNPDFEQTLKRVVPPDDPEIDRLYECHRLPELSVPEWYIQEVWRLLGWEVLMQSNDS
ncbi:hypothetical protein BJX61DRAFT_9980 [Aspergillus egyptiacus]|nr:hypothetical protein BJX61DRAFT_9980 [Aspergillus egyptiacus]